MHVGYGVDDLQMIFAKYRLNNDTALLSFYGIQHLSVIQLLIKLPGGGGPLDRDSMLVQDELCLALNCYLLLKSHRG